MKLLTLPIQLLEFWYPKALIIFLRIWKNTLLYLEEDLAVGLMLKLLFIPLFHDKSLTGRFLSFTFRLIRILAGMFAFFSASILILSLALFWFLLPILSFLSLNINLPYLALNLGFVSQIVFFAGLVLFIHHIFSHPPKKIWQIKQVSEIWQCSQIKKEDLAFNKLLQNPQVTSLLLYLELSPEVFSQFSFKAPFDLVLNRTLETGRKLGADYLGPKEFFVGCLASIYQIDNILVKFEVSLTDFYTALEFLKLKKDNWRVSLVWDEDFSVRHLRGINRGWLGVPTPNLDLVSEDLTSAASSRKLTNFVGREDTVNRLVDILSNEKGRNVLIVGEAGVGKTALVQHLAEWIISGDAPLALSTKRIVELSLVKLLSGVKNQGDLAQQIKDIFAEVKFHGNLVIFVDEIQDLGIGEVGQRFNLYALLTPYLESLDFQFIGATEPANYTKVLEKNASFARLFAKIDLPPAAPVETLPIIMKLAIEAERYQRITTSIKAVRAVVELSSRFIHNRYLPDGAIQTFNLCLQKAKDGWVKKKTVEEVIESLVDVPVAEVEEKQKIKLLNLETEIHRQMIDQEEAVLAVANSLRRSAVNLRETSRPIGSFLFVGPTGVGKTELAKTLAQVYFQRPDAFFRFDMSEYQNEDGATKLIGKEDEGGHLTEVVCFHPYCLILLDEFEKASLNVLNLFLQVLEDGRLTDGTGKTIDFTNTIIIATSNAGSLILAEGLKTKISWEEIKKQVNKELLKVFHPELINRFDEVVLFKTLLEVDLEKIVKIKLSDLTKQLKEQGYLVEFDNDLVKKLAQKGFDPVMGARPLRRLIQDTLEAQLSKLILENKLTKGRQFQAGAELLEAYN